MLIFYACIFAFKSPLAMIADVLLHSSRLSFIEGGSCYKEKRYKIICNTYDLDVFDLGIKVTYFAFFS